MNTAATGNGVPAYARINERSSEAVELEYRDPCETIRETLAASKGRPLSPIADRPNAMRPFRAGKEGSRRGGEERDGFSF